MSIGAVLPPLIRAAHSPEAAVATGEFDQVERLNNYVVGDRLNIREQGASLQWAFAS